MQGHFEPKRIGKDVYAFFGMLLLHGYSRHFGAPRGLWCEGCEDEDGNSIWLYWDEYAMSVEHVGAEVNGTVLTVCDRLDLAKVEGFLLQQTEDKELKHTLIGGYLVPDHVVQAFAWRSDGDPQS